MAGQGATVHAMHFVHGSGPIFYASLPYDREARQHLVATLWNRLSTTEGSRWQHHQSADGEVVPMQLIHGLLGRPQLLVGESPGPAVSFSEGGGKIWAALCGDGSDIGIDVAGDDEFRGKYPLHRVFQPAELKHALRLTGGELAAASALLWSIKEAVVKALGCAFHLVEPRQITVYSATAGAGDYTFAVGLSGKARERFPRVASQPLWVRSFPQCQRWLSIAKWQQSPDAHE
jgi:phosphopantetheinyl transferase (holo-ACP synthase)